MGKPHHARAVSCKRAKISKKAARGITHVLTGLHSTVPSLCWGKDFDGKGVREQEEQGGRFGDVDDAMNDATPKLPMIILIYGGGRGPTCNVIAAAFSCSI